MYPLKKNWKFDALKKYDINFTINLWKTNLITTKNEKKNN